MPSPNTQFHNNSSYSGPLVVCDTMIWYGTRSEDFPEDVKFASTWLSVIEIFSTNNILTNTGIASRAWEKLKEFSDLNLLSPSQHFHKYVNGFISYSAFNDIEQKKGTLERFDLKIISLERNRLNQFEKDRFFGEVKDIRESQIEAYKNWAETIKSFRKSYPVTNIKKSFLKSDEGVQLHWEFVTRPLVCMLLGERIKFRLIEDISAFELFLNVFNQYLIDLDLGKLTLSENDIFDVFNMIYVRKQDKYWTKERKWIKYIEKIGLGNYIYE